MLDRTGGEHPLLEGGQDGPSSVGGQQDACSKLLKLPLPLLLEWEWVCVGGVVGGWFSRKIMLQLRDSCPRIKEFQRRKPTSGTCPGHHSAEGL